MATGCANSPKTTESADTRAGFIACKEPRPEDCTMQYDPVCGDLAEGGSKTYSNACVGCSDRRVTGYRPGACDSADAAERVQ